MNLYFLKFLLFSTLLLTNCDLEQNRTTPNQDFDYQVLIDSFTNFLQKEMELKQIPALSIALVDGKRSVWLKGFGFEDKDRTVPATAKTIYRVGSVSKLFTDIGIMQLVEKGKLDLDIPVTDYLPTFNPQNHFQQPITLRQLMSHRSGLVREPPVGNYFDHLVDQLDPTVASLNETNLVYAPGTKIKYSNAGIAVVG